MRTSSTLEKLKWLLLMVLTLTVSVQGFWIYSKYNAMQTLPTVPRAQTQQGSNFKVGISLGTLKEERWLKDRDILVTKLKEKGAEVVVMNANNDDEDQLRQVKYLVEQGIHVLIIVPNDMKKAATAVEYAKSHGVKVISYDRLVLNANLDVYVSFNNELSGEEMGRYIKSKLSKGNVLIINGAQSDYNTSSLKEGYDKTLNSPGIQIVGEFWADQWLNEYAYDKTEALLKSGTQFDAILAGNDALAGAIIRALTEYRKAGKVIVVGQDADLEACQRIVRGTQNMTIYKPIDRLAEVAATLSKDLYQNDYTQIDAASKLNNGIYSIPYILLDPIVVDRDNLKDTVIKDGFHLHEELFQ